MSLLNYINGKVENNIVHPLRVLLLKWITQYQTLLLNSLKYLIYFRNLWWSFLSVLVILSMLLFYPYVSFLAISKRLVRHQVSEPYVRVDRIPLALQGEYKVDIHDITVFTNSTPPHFYSHPIFFFRKLSLQ